jgi:hypothetical protein
VPDELRVTTQYTKADFRSAARFISWRRAPRWVDFILVLSAFVAVVGKGDDPWLFALFDGLFSALVGGLAMAAMLRWFTPAVVVRRSERVNPRIFDAPSTITLSDAGLEIVTSAVSTTRAWEAASGYVETPDFFGLFVGITSAMHLVPKRDIPSPEEFRQFLEAHGVHRAKRFEFRR